jgi:hypothetical protein
MSKHYRADMPGRGSWNGNSYRLETKNEFSVPGRSEVEQIQNYSNIGGGQSILQILRR